MMARPSFSAARVAHPGDQAAAHQTKTTPGVLRIDGLQCAGILVRIHTNESARCECRVLLRRSLSLPRARQVFTIALGGMARPSNALQGRAA
jgi:hypothetical protein